MTRRHQPHCGTEMQRRRPPKILMPLARRSRVVETGGASPADVVVSWRWLSPAPKFDAKARPGWVLRVAALAERESQTLDGHAGSAVDAPIGRSEGARSGDRL
jgi:hypothetical protein